MNASTRHHSLSRSHPSSFDETPKTHGKKRLVMV